MTSVVSMQMEGRVLSRLSSPYLKVPEGIRFIPEGQLAVAAIGGGVGVGCGVGDGVTVVEAAGVGDGMASGFFPPTASATTTKNSTSPPATKASILLLLAGETWGST